MDRATDSHGFEYAARIGYGTSGVLHPIIAYIVLRLAFGSGGNADQSGALADPGGATRRCGGAVDHRGRPVRPALWRLAETVVGSHPNELGGGDDGAKKAFKRLQVGRPAVVYLGIAMTAVRLCPGGGKSNSAQNAGLTARMLQPVGERRFC